MAKKVDKIGTAKERNKVRKLGKSIRGGSASVRHEIDKLRPKRKIERRKCPTKQ